MAERFFDTSATVKHYLPEIGTATVDTLLAEVGAQHFLSILGVVELQSVFARQVRTGQITAADFALFRGKFLADIASGLWTVLPVTGGDFHLAQQLLARHGLARNLRTLDAIQLAVAVARHATTPLHAFVCADRNLNQVTTSVRAGRDESRNTVAAGSRSYAADAATGHTLGDYVLPDK